MNSIFRFTFAPLLLIISNLYSFAQLTPKTSAIISQFSNKLATDLKQDNLHGSISIAILKNDRVVWLKALGYASTENSIPADTATIYRIGSITKTFTAALLMLMVEDGKVKLDDPVENYVPEVKNLNGYSDKITLRQLASHTSGLKREPDIRNSNAGLTTEWEEKVLACIPHTYFNSAPEQEFLYSNIGYALLGLALERAAGVPYLQLVQQRILNPLHMTDTYFILPEAQLPRLAQGISNNEKGKVDLKLPVQEIKGRGYRVPNGGIFTTPMDLSKFALSLMGKPALLTDKSRKQMQQIPSGGKHYGLGLMLYKNGGMDIIGHDGSVPGYTSDMAIDKDSGYAVILLRNYNTGSTNLDADARELLKQLKYAD